MSLTRIITASGAAFSLIAPVADASAQHRYYDRPNTEVRRDRPIQSTRAPSVDSNISRKPVVAVRNPAQVVAKPTPGNKPVETIAKPVPVAPLTEEQIAAKAAVDELLAREPALLAAREIPDPALARAAAARHAAQDRRLAAMKAKEEADAASRKELEEKKRAREETKSVAIKAQQDVRAKTSKPKAEPAKPKPVAETAAISVAPPASSPQPLQPVVRMPVPNGLPMARRL